MNKKRVNVVHNISDYEIDLMLDKFFRKNAAGVDGRQLESYWNANTKEINVSFDCEKILNINEVIQ